MTQQELSALVNGGESAGVEFKATTGQRGEAARTVWGMLNGNGGFVLFGVRDDGMAVGQQVGARTIEELIESVRRIEPFVLLTPERVPLDGGREVVVLRVPGGPPGDRSAGFGDAQGTRARHVLGVRTGRPVGIGWAYGNRIIPN